MADVFISYAREDWDFVLKLHHALAKLNRESWVDWQDIPPTTAWLKEIYTGIEAAADFVFVISPESVASATCQKEIAHALANNKRLVPILHRVAPDGDVPDAVARVNWIGFRDSDDFESAFASLTSALDADLDWKRGTVGCWCGPKSGKARGATRASCCGAKTCKRPRRGKAKPEVKNPSRPCFSPSTSLPAARQRPIARD
jgi:hypothetical protein